MRAAIAKAGIASATTPRLDKQPERQTAGVADHAGDERTGSDSEEVHDQQAKAIMVERVWPGESSWMAAKSGPNQAEVPALVTNQQRKKTGVPGAME